MATDYEMFLDGFRTGACLLQGEEEDVWRDWSAGMTNGERRRIEEQGFKAGLVEGWVRKWSRE